MIFIMFIREEVRSQKSEVKSLLSDLRFPTSKLVNIIKIIIINNLILR